MSSLRYHNPVPDVVHDDLDKALGFKLDPGEWLDGSRACPVCQQGTAETNWVRMECVKCLSCGRQSYLHEVWAAFHTKGYWNAPCPNCAGTLGREATRVCGMRYMHDFGDELHVAFLTVNLVRFDTPYAADLARFEHGFLTYRAADQPDEASRKTVRHQVDRSRTQWAVLHNQPFPLGLPPELEDAANRAVADHRVQFGT